jgi:amino acid adenylation domain-containing protein
MGREPDHTVASIAHRVYAQSRKTPDAVAVVDHDVRLDYAALDALANQAELALRSTGVSPGQAVAVSLPRSWQLIVVMLGVLRCGAQVVPLDIQSPPERRRHILTDSAAAVLICDDPASSAAHSTPDSVLLVPVATVVPQGPEALEAPPVVGPPSPPAPASFLFYTSGTTGRPKGVQVRDAGILRLAEPGYIDIRAGARFSWISNPAFDATSFSVWPPLLTGGCCVVIAEEVVQTPHLLAATLRRECIDTMWVTTALFNVTVAAVPQCFASVRQVIVGGEQLNAAAILRWYATNADSPTVIYNGYGPTESTTFATCWAIPRNFTGRIIPIGRPLPRTKALVVVAPEDRVAAPGEVGELLLAGDGLAAGYQNLAEETARSFVRLPWYDGGRERFYRSGDLVRADSDGVISFVGRADRQVKVRGFRVELGGIERQIAVHPAVRQVRVCARRDDERGTNQLSAYLVIEPELSFDEFDQYLASTLPVYMRPHHVYVVDKFPLTANRKIDEAALWRMDIQPWRRAGADVPLTTPQREVLDLVSELLGVRPELRDGWAAVGGDSLKALQFRFAVRKRWGCELSQSFVLREDFARIAEAIVGAQATDRPDYPVLGAPAGTTSGSAALATSEQQRLWLLQQRNPRSRAYDVNLAFRIDGPLDTVALRRALRCVVERRPALRTRFEATPDGLRQVVTAPYDPWVEPDTEAGETADLADQFFAEPFDLAQPRMLRASWLAGQFGGLLLLQLHHIAVDGWSLNLIFADLSAAYPDMSTQPQAEAFTMLDYATWQAEWFRWPAYLRHRDELRSYVRAAGLNQGLSPQQHEQWQASFPPAKLLQRPLDAAHRATLDRLCVKLRLTRFQLLLAIWAWSVYAVTGQSRPRVAAPVANRALQEFENTVGMFANTLLLPLEVVPGEDLRSQIARISEVARAVLDHEEVAFADVLTSRSTMDRPFDYLFVLENTDFFGFALPGCTVQPLWRTAADAKCPMTMSVVEHGGGLELLCEYAQGHFTDEEVATIADIFVHSLDVLDQGHAITPEELAAPYRRVLCDHVHGETVPLTYQTIAEGFARQVQLTPTSPALQSANGVVSYAELDAHAAALAERLRAVHPQIDEEGPCHVALYFQPSVEHVVALLALARLNVTAVPLDPAYPPALLRHVVTQAAPLCVLLGPGCRAEFEKLGVSGVTVEPVTLSPSPPLSAGPAGAAGTRPHRGIRPLYTLFTSGSTGIPKGVEVFDRVLCNLGQWQQRSGGLGAPAMTQQFSMLSFDVSFQEIFGTLCGGGCLQLIQPEWRHDIPVLLEQLEFGGVERIFLPYVALQLLADYGVRLGRHPSRLREVITAGEQLICTPAIRSWFAGLPGARLFNHYGPTETHVVASLCLDGDPDQWPQRPAIGRPIANSVLRVVDASGESVGHGVVGDLLIGGLMVTRCYLNDPELNEDRFVESPELYYRSGDRAYEDRDGLLHYVGRQDQQVKVSGYRMQLEQVELALLEHRDIAQAVVVQDGDHLVALLRCCDRTPSFEELTAHLATLLPTYVRVDRFRELTAFPLTPSGKLDRGSVLDAPGVELVHRAETWSRTSTFRALELQLARVFETVIGSPIDLNQTFFDAGASSLGLMRFHLRCTTELDLQFSVTDLFEHVTISDLVKYLKGIAAEPVSARSAAVDEPIAVIGMAVRLPGSPDLTAFWDLTCAARSGVEYFAATQNLVGARSQLDGMFDFDPQHFGISARDAALMDPQQRHVLMSCVEALAHAGISNPAAQQVGLVASCGENTYFQAMLREADPAQLPDKFQLELHHDKDYLATKAAYLLGLTGPAFTAQAACASSLVAVHLAAGLLRQRDAEVMLVSAALIDPDLSAGYHYAAQHISSPDGHCRPFSDDANGTLGASGVATIVLKPLSVARRDGDRVYSVITGSAINNDGSTKLSFSAPSPAGQLDVVRTALERSGRSGRDVGYIEAHGTGTRLGDPVELRALRQALRTAEPQQVALSSVKSQLGHLGAAAGIVGLIRATLSIYHGVLPPTVDFRAPNPEFGSDWEPFHVPTSACPWPADRDRVAGVSSFGIGGTNAHVIVEAVHQPTPGTSDAPACLVLSSSSASALRADALRVADHLDQHPDSYVEVLRHLQSGRPAQRWRIATACADAGQAVAWLRGAPSPVFVEPSGKTAATSGLAPGQLADHWLAGDAVDWAGPSAQAPWDFPAPSFDCATYSFKRRQDAPTPSSADDAQRLPEADWLYQPGWVRSRRATRPAAQQSRSVVLMTAGPLDPTVIDTFRTAYGRVIQVCAAAAYARRGTDSFEVDPADPASLAELLGELADGTHSGIDWLHALALSVVGPVGQDELDRARWACLDTPAAVLQAISDVGVAPLRPRVFWLSAHARPVDGPVLRPEVGLLVGATEVAPFESAVPGCWLDLPDTDWGVWATTLTGLLVDESTTLPRQLALRQHYWWEQVALPVRQAAQLPEEPPKPLSQQGVSLTGTHVVLGGTGGVGAAIAAWLLEQTGGDVLLVARNSGIPEELSPWADRVTVIEADLAAAHPQQVATSIGRHADRLASVVHAVGVPTGGLIARRDPPAAHAGTAAKLCGALVVEQLIESHRPELAVYCSSMAAYFGGVGQLDYAASNGVLDGFAHYRSRTAETTLRIGINWDIWRDRGMAARVPHPDARHRAHLAVGMSIAEGKRLFGRALQMQLPQLLVSTTDLDTARTFYGPAPSSSSAEQHPAAATPTVGAQLPPEKDLADLLAAELCNTLAVDALDPDDCLYDLGADSLTLLELIDRIKEVSGVGLDLAQLSHQVSLAEIVTRIEEDAGRAEDVTVEVWQEGTDRDVLCLIHPVGGDIQIYRALVSALPRELTVCLIADPGLKLSEPPQWTLAERARAYHSALQKRFPPERWHLQLAGWSFGAWVAIEMAHYAESVINQRVDALYLLDPPPVDGGAAIREYGPDELATVFQHELGQFGEQDMSPSAREYTRRLAACCEANMRSMVDHTPPRLRSTPSWLWLAERPVTSLPYNSLGPESMEQWRTRLPLQGEPRTLDATHYDVVRSPHVDLIAGTIGAANGELVR